MSMSVLSKADAKDMPRALVAFRETFFWTRVYALPGLMGSWGVGCIAATARLDTPYNLQRLAAYGKSL